MRTQARRPEVAAGSIAARMSSSSSERRARDEGRGRFYAGGTTGTRIEFTIFWAYKADAPVTPGHPMPPSRYCHSSFNSNNSGVFCTGREGGR